MVPLAIPGLMIIGFDVCRDTKDRSLNYGAMIATIDHNFGTECFRIVMPYHHTEVLANVLPRNVKKALSAYWNICNTLPSKILFYRVGLATNQTKYLYDNEAKEIKEMLGDVYKKAGMPTPGFTNVIVTEETNIRVFQEMSNPKAGTIIDGVITLPERYVFNYTYFDLFIILQERLLFNESGVGRRGSPTYYYVLEDSILWGPDNLQLLTYKLCHLYYNSCKTVRVPGVCKYAFKL